MREAKKKSEKRKVRLNENSIIKHFLKNQARANILADAFCVQICTYFVYPVLTLSYFYDIEVLCDKQMYFHCIP